MDLYEIIGRLYANGLSEAERSAAFKEQMESAQRTVAQQQETINNQRSSIIDLQKEIALLLLHEELDADYRSTDVRPTLITEGTAFADGELT